MKEVKFIDSTIEDVKFHLANQSFDGPLDLLVKMVSESKINIMDIFVSDITRQYVEFVKNLKELDYEYVAEYIALAATLIEIKASKILPPEEGLDEYGAELAGIERQLISDVEKKMLLSMPDKLRPLENVNLFYNEPIYDDSDYKLIVEDLSLQKLLDAYILVLEKIEYRGNDSFPKTIRKERFTVADKIKEIASILRTEGGTSFFALFDEEFSRPEILNIFLAVLELVKIQIAEAKQVESGDILLAHSDKDKYDAVKLNDEEIMRDVEEYR